MESAEGFRLPHLDLAWIDTAGLVLVGVMLLLGALHGLWWQVIRLVGLAGAVLLARAVAPRLAAALASFTPEVPERILDGSAWLVLFLCGLAAATGLGALGRRLLSTLRLGLVDRAGGALAGILTGVLVHLALVAAVCQLAPADWVSRNVGGSRSESALSAVGARWSLIVGPDAALRIEELLGAPPGSGEPGAETPEPASRRERRPAVH